jgi:hypothetical protein
MCKAVDRGMKMGDIRLLEKQGGRSGHWRADTHGGEGECRSLKNDAGRPDTA